jgi:hypothetical protein
MMGNVYSPTQQLSNTAATNANPEDRHDEERQILTRIRRGERIDRYEIVRIFLFGRAVPAWLGSKQEAITVLDSQVESAASVSRLAWIRRPRISRSVASSSSIGTSVKSMAAFGSAPPLGRWQPPFCSIRICSG